MLVLTYFRREEDAADDEAELTYLKLKLRIVEIQALPYVPEKKKDMITEGIRRWKLDWADVDDRFRGRRKRRGSDRSDVLFSGSE